MTDVKYLGLTVCERLNFSYDLQLVKEKLSKSVGAVKRVLRVDYGLGRKAVRVRSKGLFIPKLTYFKKKFDFDPSAKNLHGPDHDKR